MADQQAEEDKSSAGAPYSYPPRHHHISSSSNLMASNIQTSSFNFERSKYSTNDDVDQIYDLTTGVEMIGFHHHNKTGTRSGAVATTTDFYNQLQQQGGGGGGLIMTGSRRSNHVNDLLMGGVDDDECAGNRSSLRCVSFPCEGNERPSQGLSLSLNSNNPSSISLQSFELRRPPAANTPPPTTSTTTTISHQHQGSTAAAGTHNDFMRFISPSSSSPNWPNTSRYHDHGYHVGKQPSSSSTNFVGGSSVTTGTGHHDEFNDHHHQASGSGQHFVALSYSMYFPAAQELLNEFCSLGTKVADDSGHNNKKKQQYNNWDDQQNDINIINRPNSSSGTGGGNCSSSSREQQSILYALDLLELQKRKRRLLAMLEELERRYRNYSNQMKSVVSSFEAVAGDGSASVYTSLASKAMSRHFRCLKDGIVTQIKVFNKVIAEKDPSSSSAAAAAGTSTTTAGGGGGGGGGITKGETPRLRILDQTLRQQRAYQQMSMMETHPWRPQRGLPERSVSLLRAWLFEHFLHPYPSDVDKHILARQTGLTRSQVSNWFINARVRLWKPMVEEMYLEETKEEQEKFMASSSHHEHHDQLLINNSNENNDGIICNNNNNLLNDSHANYGLQTTMQQPQQDIDDQKPNVDALIRFGRDSQCISSIITANNNINPDKNINKSIKIPATHHHANNTSLHLHDQQQEEQGNYGRGVEPFGPIDIDFASYNENAHQHHHHHNFGGVAPGSGSNTAAGAGGVSLTLGLQQNGGNNIGGAAGPVNLAFSNPAATATMHVEHSLYYPTGDHDDRMVEPAVHEYSLFDGDHGAQNLPYRNLMGAQMLHDFA